MVIGADSEDRLFDVEYCVGTLNIGQIAGHRSVFTLKFMILV